jgi:DNA primase
MSVNTTGAGTGSGPSGPQGSNVPRGGDDWVERVRAATDIVELIGERVPLRRVGRNFMGRCPFHEEKTPSFSVNAERQFYHCFSCKVGGDAFKFVQEMEKVGFLEAVELLSRRAGIPVPERRAGERGKRAGLLEALDAAATAYEQWLGDPEIGAQARAYLERRGIERETQRAFRLGLAPAGWEGLVGRLRGRFSDEVLLEARLAGRREGGRSTFDWFRNRLMVPLIAPGGAVLGFGARAFGDEQPKYLNSPESAVYHKGQYLFALEQARKFVKPEGEMVVVEGYFDAIAMHQAGIRNTVATSGTALTADHAHVLKRMARGVALTYDGDAAGQQAMLRSLGVLLAEGLDVVVVDLPAGEDPDSLVRRAGVDGWCKVRDSAYDAVEFVHRHVLRTTTGGDPRERALHVVVRLLAGVRDTIRHRLLVERASQVFGLSEGVIARAARQATASGERVPEPVSAAVRAQRRVEGELERRLLRGLWLAPELLDEARAELQPADLEDPGARALAGWWWEHGVTLPEGDGEAAALARELASTERETDPSAEVLGTIRRLVVRRLQRELRARRAGLAGASGETAERLMQEIQDIARTLQKLST